jgi:hypothetical protein
MLEIDRSGGGGGGSSGEWPPAAIAGAVHGNRSMMMTKMVGNRSIHDEQDGGKSIDR